MRWMHPIWLFLLIPLIGLWIYDIRRLKRTTILFPNVKSLKTIANRKTQLISRSALFCRILAVIFIIIALARPQGVFIEQEVSSDGVAIMLALDVSGSMAAEDFKPNNRLAVAKSTIQQFINKRHSDQIGLVVFGGDAYTQCPMTLDYGVLGTFLSNIELDMAGQGTAIGMAVATALNRMRDTPLASKVIILLTDGESNRGEISPIRSAELARDLNVKIYAIGIGKEGGAPIPYIHPVYGKVYSKEKTYLDDKTLTKMAAITQGRYFRAVDETALQDVLEQIDQLETSKIKSVQYHHYSEWFPYCIGIALLLLCIELILSNVMLVRIP